MNLFRTCRISDNAPALRFVKRARDIASVIKLLGTKEMIDDVFNRPLPILKIYESRFGPEGFSKNILYTSEKRDTTLYEYGYHLILDSSLLNRPVYASTYRLSLKTKNKPIDVQQLPSAAQVLSRTSYNASHAWIRTIDAATLDVIQYPNVRDPNPGGLNFAIFNRSSVTSASGGSEPLILTALPNNRVRVQRPHNPEFEIQPIS